VDAEAEAEIGWLVEVVEAVRSLKGEMNVAAAKPPLTFVAPDALTVARIARHRDLLLTLARASEVTTAEAAPEGAVTLVSGGATVALTLAGIIDLSAERARLAREIAADLAKLEPMNRLLQGDVGSGKTAVAVYALLAAVATPVPTAEGVTQPAGGPATTPVASAKPERYQAAIMAPTELLARQHFASLERLLAGSGVEVQLLVGGQTAKERQRITDRIASGSADIVAQAITGP
jgi:RecG-like helicase